MKRSKEETRQKLIESVGKIIEKDGFEKIGINAIAKKAGVDKVLIYRYFGGLNGLLSEYVIQEDLVKNLLDEFDAVDINNKDSFIKFASDFYLKQIQHLRENKKYQEILLWELHEKNDVTTRIAQVREEKSLKLFEKFDNIVNKDKIDIPAINNIIIGGIIYQILRTRHVDQFSGVDYSGELGWKRMEDSVLFLINIISDFIFDNAQ